MIRQDQAVIQGLCSPALQHSLNTALCSCGEESTGAPAISPSPSSQWPWASRALPALPALLLRCYTVPSWYTRCMMPQQPMDARLLPPTAIPREQPTQPQHACGSSCTRGEQTPVCLHLWVLTKNRGEHPCPQCRWGSRHHRKDYLSKVMW